MRKLSMIVTAEQAGRSVKNLLRETFLFAPSQLSHLKFVEGAVLKNGTAVRLVDTAAAGDDIEVFLESGRAGELPLPILYEDEDLLVIDKPAGMTVHGVAGGAETVESLWRKSCALPFHAVNRLDRGTSGAMVAAKNGYIHDRLRNMLHTEDFLREYLALAEGRFTEDCGEIDQPLAREDGKTFASSEGKPALTRYEVLARGESCTLLRLQLFTGRTHQIRAHCAAVGHPLLGDALYGGGKGKRPALHSWKISLRQPIEGNRILVTAPLPEDLRELCQKQGIDVFRYLANEEKRSC